MRTSRSATLLNETLLPLTAGSWVAIWEICPAPQPLRTAAIRAATPTRAARAGRRTARLVLKRFTQCLLGSFRLVQANSRHDDSGVNHATMHSSRNVVPAVARGATPTARPAP